MAEARRSGQGNIGGLVGRSARIKTTVDQGQMRNERQRSLMGSRAVPKVGSDDVEMQSSAAPASLCRARLKYQRAVPWPSPAALVAGGEGTGAARWAEEGEADEVQQAARSAKPCVCGGWEIWHGHGQGGGRQNRGEDAKTGDRDANGSAAAAGHDSDGAGGRSRGRRSAAGRQDDGTVSSVAVEKLEPTGMAGGVQANGSKQPQRTGSHPRTSTGGGSWGGLGCASLANPPPCAAMQPCPSAPASPAQPAAGMASRADERSCHGLVGR
ncbi:hypothetical protein BDV95DRAFT_44941 [Massariosphaeria phaeospora]|uniref:Uncharacterized protein n=1 Tax=Massariosphaeria phaeospora TaxID=100035 RepID=A0A7C8I5Y1_9PLEO|nr:hypothetical protein BDV95DRAFT_44941 [Massariosphaeria phaeospora]